MYPTIDRTETGKKIRKLMLERDISVKDIKQYLGLSCVQSVYHWLDGRTLPTIDNFYALSELFQVPIDEIVCGDRKGKRIKPKRNPWFLRLEKYYHKLQLYLAIQ